MLRYYEFHGRRDPRDLGPEHATAFLSDLALRAQVAASTQNQALAAVVFLYRFVLERDLPWLHDLVRARRPRRVPVVPTRNEALAILAHLPAVPRLMASLLYGAGLRLLECCRLRIADVDFDRDQIAVRHAKRDRDRLTLLPGSLKDPLAQHLGRVRSLFDRDLAEGAGWVALPHAASPPASGGSRDWPHQWLFPATRRYVDRATGQHRRHHLHQTVLQSAVRQAILAAGLQKRITCHSLRHAFATHLAEDGCNIRVIQELLGHRDVATTMIYTRLARTRLAAVTSPMDSALGDLRSPDAPSPAPRDPRDPFKR
jgi:integron integrase